MTPTHDQPTTIDDHAPSPRISRRQLFAGTFAAGFTGVTSAYAVDGTTRHSPASDARRIAHELQEIERRHHVRIGLWRSGSLSSGSLSSGSLTGKHLSHREDDRFLMCSTSKALVVATVLSKDHDGALLGKELPVPSTGLIEHSPATSEHVGSTMTVRELSEAALSLSDNTAVNILTDHVAGHAEVNRFLRRLHDRTSRLDRDEPFLNERSGVLDTTTPAAYASSFARILAGRTLSASHRELMAQWMLPNEEVPSLIAQSLPGSWDVVHRSGKGANGELNDVAHVTRPDGRAGVLAIFTTRRHGGSDESSSAAIQAATKSALL
jgi:beta-lactamase class A